MLIDELYPKTRCPHCDTYHDRALNKCPKCQKYNDIFRIKRMPERAVFFHPFVQIGMFLVGFAFFGMFILEFIVSLFKDAFPGDNAFKSITFMTIIYSTMLVSLLVLALFTGRRKYFVEKYTNGIDYIYGIGYAVTVVMASVILGAIMSLFFKIDNNVNQDTIETVALSYPLFLIPVICIIGPLCEELTYRVGLFSFLRRYNKYVAFVVVSIVFAFIHFDFEAKDIVLEFQSLPTYIVTGFILTLAYEHRGPACSMTAHVLYNSYALLTVFIRAYAKS